MPSIAIFRKTYLDLWARIRGVLVSLSWGAKELGIRAGLAVGRPSQLEL